MRFDNTNLVAARFDSLVHARDLVLKHKFEAAPEPMWLKKFNMLSFYPVDFIEYRPRFEVWGPAGS